MHWLLDVTFRADERRVRRGHAPQIFFASCELALMLLRSHQTCPWPNLRSRRKTADRLPNFRALLPKLVPRQ